MNLLVQGNTPINAVRMPSAMSIADLELVPEGTPGSQPVAVLEEPFRISLRRAAIPEPGTGEIRVRVR